MLLNDSFIPLGFRIKPNIHPQDAGMVQWQEHLPLTNVDQV